MSTRAITHVCVAVAMLAGTIGAAAQQPGAQTPQTDTRPPQSQTGTRDTAARGATAGTMTLVGCLEAGNVPSAFTLNVIEQPGMTGRQQAGATSSTTTGATASTGAGATAGGATATSGTLASLAGQRVQLIGAGNVSLKDHTGHQVEITGTLAPQGNAAGRTTGPAADMRLNVTNAGARASLDGRR